MSATSTDSVAVAIIIAVTFVINLGSRSALSYFNDGRE